MKLIIDGRRQRNWATARRLIVVDGRNVWLRQAEYSILLHIADHQLSHSEEWVRKDTWHKAFRGNVRNYTCTLRKQIGASGLRVPGRPQGGWKIDLPLRNIKIRPNAEFGPLLAEVYV